MTGESPSAVQGAPSRRRALINAGALIIIDALIMNQGGIAALVLLGVVVIGVPRALLGAREIRAWRLGNVAIYAAASLSVFALNVLNNRIAAERGAEIATALKAFHVAKGHYPGTLSDLAPDFIARVPRAKYTVGFSEFRYYPQRSPPILFYVALPPFGRMNYRFEKEDWVFVD